MKPERRGIIIHNILLLKHFTLHHLRSVSCHGMDDVKMIVKELKLKGFLSYGNGQFHLTGDIDVRFDLRDEAKALIEAAGWRAIWQT